MTFFHEARTLARIDHLTMNSYAFLREVTAWDQAEVLLNIEIQCGRDIGAFASTSVEEFLKEAFMVTPFVGFPSDIVGRLFLANCFARFPNAERICVFIALLSPGEGMGSFNAYVCVVCNAGEAFDPIRFMGQHVRRSIDP